MFTSLASSACDYLLSDVLHLKAGCVYRSSATVICCSPPVPPCLDTVGAGLWYSIAVTSELELQATNHHHFSSTTLLASGTQKHWLQSRTHIIFTGNVWKHTVQQSVLIGCVFIDDSRCSVCCWASSAITAGSRKSCTVCWEAVCERAYFCLMTLRQVKTCIHFLERDLKWEVGLGGWEVALTLFLEWVYNICHVLHNIIMWLWNVMLIPVLYLWLRGQPCCGDSK